MNREQWVGEETFQEIFPEEIGEWLRRGARIIDLRERSEFEEGHLPGAENVPLGELPGRGGELEDSSVVLVCASGSRSEKAARMLSRDGFGEVATLLGGTFGWARRGRPLE